MSTANPSVSNLQQDQVAQRAYEFWLSEGCPCDRAESHWLRAEQELRGAMAAPSVASAPHGLGETTPSMQCDNRARTRRRGLKGGT